MSKRQWWPTGIAWAPQWIGFGYYLAGDTQVLRLVRIYVTLGVY